MSNINELSSKIFSLLKGNGLQIKIFNADGAETTDPNDGRRFFAMRPNIMVTVDEEGNKVEFNKGPGTDKSVESIQKRVRRLADQFLMNFNIKVFGKSIQPKDYSYQAKMDKGNSMMESSVKPVNHYLVGEIMKKIRHFGGKISESDLAGNLGITDLSEIRPVLNRLVSDGKLTVDVGYGRPVYSISVEETVMENFSKMFGSLKTSRQVLENVRILVRHKRPVDESVKGARSRSISAIFLECNGERFRFPYTHLPGARAMAQHLAHGGQINDKVGAYITESVGQLLKLQSFNRYVTNNNLINEDSSGIVDTVKENIDTLRVELKKLTGSKTYESVKARIETFERETLAEDDVSQLKDLFTIRRFDEKFEEVLPIIKQLIQEKDTYHKRIEEAASRPVLLRKQQINTTPVFEFASENAKFGFKLNELALRIVENEELAEFINKIGRKLCKEGVVNEFEKAILKQVLENTLVEGKTQKQDIKESAQIEQFFNKFIPRFY